MPSSARGRAAILALALASACDDDASDGDETQSPRPAAEPKLDTPPPSAPAPAVDPWTDAGLEALRLPLHLSWPVENVHITSTFGWRVDPVAGAGMRMHRGVDFRGDTGDLVLSIADGTIAFTGVDPALGNVVVVDHGLDVTSVYGHLSDVLVHEGVPVERGAAIGLVGNTGQSEAPHLHLTIELRDEPVDPLLLLGQPLHAPDAIVEPLPPTSTPDPTPPPQSP